MSAASAKAALRTQAHVARKSAHGRVDAAPALRRVADWLGRQAGIRRVSAYAAIRTEVDSLPLMEQLHAAGLRVCLPIVVGADLPLTFRDWHPGMILEAGAFGASVPPGAEEVIPDAVIAPLLAFDRRGYRLGYGGGYYDRTLALLRQRAQTLAIGLAYSAQEVPEVPAEPTDIALDAIATESALILR